MAIDQYGGAGQGNDLLSPAAHAAAVTPSDTVDMAYASKRLWIGGAGNVTLITVGGETVDYVGVPAGVYLSVRATRVKATGTTSTSIVAEY